MFIMNFTLKVRWYSGYSWYQEVLKVFSDKFKASESFYNSLTTLISNQVHTLTDRPSQHVILLERVDCGKS